ncbi:class I SAM-dependent methyltransferase [Enterococcus ureasiticus]|uniref:Methylase n=1 Tax=Enterococcus ureasiticus TaxID=903984 RepID=A0A1E5GQE4_9ENTE|nr:class I SAM-dependent methyltransferase [Enterococcus ureasiticus]OEG14460.1 methylase [Enterococcus ureasiticus]
MNIFDRIAQHYDSPKQLELASIITKGIQTELGDTTGKTGLDYGCGTGLIGLQISDEFEEMLFVDPSKEMIHVVDQKIAQMNRINVKTVVGSFSNEDTLNIKADLIIVSLVLLHVPDTLDILKSLYQALNPKGHILVVDFDKNENINHEKVHNGFSQLELKTQLEKIGFKSISSRTFYHGQNIFMNQDASMFILNAEK